MSMKSWIKTLTLALAVAGAATSANAQQFFRIGTGGTAGTYYPVGGMIANSISQPGKLIATAVASNGSVANINGILGGSLEAGFTQSDVAYWAYSGTGTFDGKPKAQDLRLIATLYPESIHLVARKGSGIKTVADLRGKRVSISELASSGAGIELVPIVGPEIDKLRSQQEFFTPDTIAANTYQNVGEVKTISINAQLVTSAKLPEQTVYDIVKALYSDATRKTLDNGHAKGKLITKENAVKGAGIPFHAGAEKYYKEVGLLK